MELITVSIEKLRNVENKALALFRDMDSMRKYLRVVGRTYSLRWYNSYIIFDEGNDVTEINTESEWLKSGYNIINNDNAYNILIPKKKTEFISNETGEHIDINILTDDELGQALLKKYIYKRSYTADLKECLVYDVSCTDKEFSSLGMDDETRDKIKNALSELYDVQADNLKELIMKVTMKIVYKVRKSREVNSSIIKPTDVAVITNGAAYAIASRLFIDDNFHIDEAFNGWLHYLHGNVKDSDILASRYLRCLDQISLVCNEVLTSIDEYLGETNHISEEIIDKNYNLMDLLKAAEADWVNRRIHEDKLK